MERYNFKPSTAGEQLFLFITNRIIGREKISGIYNLDALSVGGRQEDLFSYYLGILSSNITSRIIKKAARIASLFEDEKEHQKQLTQYFQRSLEIPRSPSNSDIDRLASLSLDAERASRKDIISSVRSKFEKPFTQSCYICGEDIYTNTTDQSKKIQLEHIWPQSFGGDSSVDNLLPSCRYCNEEKGHMLLWQNAHVHSFALKPDPSQEEIKDITRKIKIAKHRKTIFSYANNNRTTLKDAALSISHANLKNIKAVDRDDAIDFFNFEFY